jgi:hypothetical protein
VATAVLVVIMPDCGRACMSKIFNDGRMTANGFIGDDKRKDTVGDAGPLQTIVAVDYHRDRNGGGAGGARCGATRSRNCR